MHSKGLSCLHSSCRTAPRVAHLLSGAVKLENVLTRISYCTHRALASHVQTFKTLEDKTRGKGF
jgi:hypothetical protein